MSERFFISEHPNPKGENNPEKVPINPKTGKPELFIKEDSVKERKMEIDEKTVKAKFFIDEENK